IFLFSTNLIPHKFTLFPTRRSSDLTIVEMLNLDYVEWVTSPYIGLVVFAIIFFILSYFIVDYIVGFLRWIEEALIKVPIIDLFFGSVGLILGLVVAYLINIPI